MNTFTDAALPLIMGFLLLKLFMIWRRRKDSRNTPYHFELKFWWHDNWISTVFHIVLAVVLVLYLIPVVNYVVGHKATPKEIASFLNGMPPQLLFFLGGCITAMPMQWFEKKTRALKKRLKLMAK